MRTVFDKLRERPTSRALALKAYYLDMAGVPLNAGKSGAPILEMRAEARDKYNAARERGLVATIRATCFDCVGGSDDPGPRQRVRDCKMKACQLHPVRPWQAVKGRLGQGKRPPKDEDSA